MRLHTTICKTIAGLAAAALGLGALTLTATPALATPETPATETPAAEATTTETPVAEDPIAAPPGQVPDTQESGDEEAGAGEGNADPDGTGESETPVVDNDTNEPEPENPEPGAGDPDENTPPAETPDSEDPESGTGEPSIAGELSWGIRESFRTYVTKGAAHGKINVARPATGKQIFKFPQISGGNWNAETKTGTVRYGGAVRFTGHCERISNTKVCALDLTISNPRVIVKDAKTASVVVDYRSHDRATNEWTDGSGELATLSLPKGESKSSWGGAVKWADASATLTQRGSQIFQDFYSAGAELDKLTFIAGKASNTAKPVTPPKHDDRPAIKKPQKKAPKPAAVSRKKGGAEAAGSLTWGISSGFADYTTNKSRPGGKSGGKIITNGVGGGRGGWVFPQASGGSWSKKNQTGTVRFSGVVTFTAHKGLMNESFANPVITVTSASSGTISVGGRSYGLNLAAAGKTTGKNGEVTWTGVPVNGSISGGSGSAGGSIAVDPLSFTVGVAGGASYGSTEEGEEKTVYTAAATPPTTTGLQILSDADKLTPGGRIEIQATGFDADDENILVVLYSDPIVLDDTAKADADGTVTWSGTLPDNIEPGEHTLTLQGSSNAGAIIKIASDKDKKSAKNAAAQASELLATEESAQQSGIAAIAAYGPYRTWEWWASAAGLVVIAACTTLLAIRQRKQHGAGTPGHTV